MPFGTTEMRASATPAARSRSASTAVTGKARSARRQTKRSAARARARICNPATRARNLSNGTGWRQSEGNYAQLALLSLALLAETTGSAEARESFAWLAGAGAPFTAAVDFARDPTCSVVPRGVARGAAGAACRPVGR
jgi:hypothetical protein